MTLGILYHMPFWQAADGSLWEAEGSFARYVESLAPYFDHIVLCVPMHAEAQPSGSKLRAANVSLAPLPYFPGPKQFYPKLLQMWPRLRAWVDGCDVINLRVPSPAAYFAFRIARARRKPVFLLVVGDLGALLPHLGYRGLKRALYGCYVTFEEWAIRKMTAHALTFANGAALTAKHAGTGRSVYETKTSTVQLRDIASRTDALTGARARILTVSRIDPRKGLRILPAVVATLRAGGHDVSLDIVGPTVGQAGEAERNAIVQESQQLGVDAHVTFRGPVALDELIRAYREFDVFVLPTKPGEGIPRVLLEAMAGGLPVVTTSVAGITSLIAHEQNGLLIDGDSAPAIAAAIARLIDDPALRRRIIDAGYEAARAHTIEQQAEQMMRRVGGAFGLTLSRRTAH